MAQFFASGRAVDVVLVFMLIEAVMLIGWRQQSVVSVALTILPGAMMLLGLRAALTGMAWPWVALALSASLPFHLADMRRRGFFKSAG
jgi:hypothetical protein